MCFNYNDDIATAAAALPAIAAAAATHPQYTILTPDIYDASYMARLCEQSPPIPNARLFATDNGPSSPYADVAWPWRSLTLSLFNIEDILKLPDPIGGQYEVTVTSEFYLVHEFVSKVRSVVQ